METLDKRENTSDMNFEPNEGERTLLSSNKGGMRSPSLVLEDNISTEEKELLNQLAEILVEGMIWRSKNEIHQ